MDTAKKTRTNLIKKIANKLTKEDIAEFAEFIPGTHYQELGACLSDDIDTVSLLAHYHTGVTESHEHVIDVLLFDEKITKL
jgi:hypothetical protein